MIQRFLFAGYAVPEESYRDLGNPAVSRLCLSRFGDMLFLYLEAELPDGATLRPENCVGGATKPFPDGSDWVWMPELYHFSKPLSEEHWRRKLPNKRPWVRLNRIRRDKFASYVFYHHRLQEEQPGTGDKYGIIGLFGDYLYLYLELPEEVETVRYPGELQTHDSPSTKGKPSEWDHVMSEHFVIWEDFPEEWREIETLLFR